jgi:MSHA biogenesis protein MshP
MLTMSHKVAYPKKQQGSAIVLAIFVIIIVSLLGAALVSLQRDSAKGSSYEVYAARAYLSAYSASEIALVNLFPLGASAANATNCTGADISVPLGSDVGFHGCTANYQCEAIIPVNSASLSTRYKVISTAVCENAQTVTRRQITVEAVSI